MPYHKTFLLLPDFDDFEFEQRDSGCCEMKGTMVSGTAEGKQVLVTISCN